MKYLIVISFVSLLNILSGSFNAKAQESDNKNLYDTLTESKETIYSDNIPVQPDTTRYRTTYTSTVDSINRYKADKKFNYIYYLDSILRQNKIPVETVSSENFRELNKKRSSAQNSQPGPKAEGNIFSNPLMRVILWILAFCFIGYILYKLFLTGGIFRRNSFRQNHDNKTADQNTIEISGYDKLVNEAVNIKNYRLAIRYLYLQTLQKLFAAGLLQFSADKTNHQYVTELYNNPYHKEFSFLTTNYEYVWYGNFNISEEAYPDIQKKFKQYHQKI